jgi:hypothetical protein
MHVILRSAFVADKLRFSKNLLIYEYNVTTFSIKKQFSNLETLQMAIKESQGQTI